MRVRGYSLDQRGYTLVEVIIALAIGSILMTALTSVVLTSVRASDIATSRVEASSQIRNFDSFAYDDFAASEVPAVGSCGGSATPCTTEPIVLSGTQVSNSIRPVPGDTPVTVTYTWDGSDVLDRQVDWGPPVHAATGVTAFSWYVDESAAFPTVVVRLTVTVRGYSLSQTLLFYPRLNP